MDNLKIFSGNANLRLAEAIVAEMDKELGDIEVGRFPDGETMVTGCSEGEVKFWNLETGKLERTINKSKADFQSVVFSPDGGLVIAGSQDGAIEIYDAKTGENIPELIQALEL